MGSCGWDKKKRRLEEKDTAAMKMFKTAFHFLVFLFYGYSFSFFV